MECEGRCPNWTGSGGGGDGGGGIEFINVVTTYQIMYDGFVVGDGGYFTTSFFAFPSPGGNSSGNTSGGGQTCAGTLRTGCLVNEAVSKAQELLMNKECADFLAGVSLMDPAQVLSELMAGNPQYGTIQVGPTPMVNGAPAVATTELGPPITSENLAAGASSPTRTTNTAIITVNSDPNSIFNSGWNASYSVVGGVSNTTRNAIFMLHELGHAINDLSGFMASGIMFDGNRVPGGNTVSAANTQNVFDHCLPR